MKSLVRIAAFAMLCAGCEAVPDLTFVDAAADDDGGAIDAGIDGAGGVDATNDAPAMCPTTPPGSATTCCGTNNAYPCAGNCGTTQCATCVSMCGTGRLCCGKMNGMVTCLAIDGHCP